jgi:hypothetical protein
LRPTRRKHRNSKAVSPVISTVILTGTIVALLCVTIVFVSNRLWSNVAESDFNSAKQYMQTIGLQMDDVAWTIGRKETIRYSSSYGYVGIAQNTLNYTISIKKQGSSVYQYFASYNVSTLLFNIPVSEYSLTNNYYEPIFPQVVSNLTFSGTSAPVARVFAIEKLPMNDGSFARVVVAPAIRVVSSTVNSSSSKVYYLKLYLPRLVKGSIQGSAQSLTMTGTSIETRTAHQITSIQVTVGFPNAAQGFDNSFFNFPSSLSQTVNIPGGYNDAILELYAGTVTTVTGQS